MNHKIPFILFGATTGAVMTLLVIQPHMIFVNSSANAAVEDTYRELNLFGEVYERVRDDYV
jgi:carboxyl-terminal processing protease